MLIGCGNRDSETAVNGVMQATTYASSVSGALRSQETQVGVAESTTIAEAEKDRWVIQDLAPDPVSITMIYPAYPSHPISDVPINISRLAANISGQRGNTAKGVATVNVYEGGLNEAGSALPTSTYVSIQLSIKRTAKNQSPLYAWLGVPGDGPKVLLGKINESSDSLEARQEADLSQFSGLYIVQQRNPITLSPEDTLFAAGILKKPKVEYLENGSASQSLASSSSSPLPLAPFDGCNSIQSYDRSDWFPALRSEAKRIGLFELDSQRISDACLSMEYFIFLASDKSHSQVYRFSLNDRSLQKAMLTKSYNGDLSATKFGKRKDDKIPLLNGLCVTGVYNVRTNRYAASDFLCRYDNVVCTEAPQTIPTGDVVFPSLPEFRHLRHLGPIFTASRCGPHRFGELIAQQGEVYPQGSSIVLREPPNPLFRGVLESVGYYCSTQDCKHWTLRSSVNLFDLLRLMPFALEILYDDCVNCG